MRCILSASDCQLYIHVFPKQAADVCLFKCFPVIYGIGGFVATAQFYFKHPNVTAWKFNMLKPKMEVWKMMFLFN